LKSIKQKTIPQRGTGWEKRSHPNLPKKKLPLKPYKREKRKGGGKRLPPTNKLIKIGNKGKKKQKGNTGKTIPKKWRSPVKLLQMVGVEKRMLRVTQGKKKKKNEKAARKKGNGDLNKKVEDETQKGLGDQQKEVQS